MRVQLGQFSHWKQLHSSLYGAPQVHVSCHKDRTSLPYFLSYPGTDFNWAYSFSFQSEVSFVSYSFLQPGAASKRSLNWAISQGTCSTECLDRFGSCSFSNQTRLCLPYCKSSWWISWFGCLWKSAIWPQTLWSETTTVKPPGMVTKTAVSCSFWNLLLLWDLSCYFYWTIASAQIQRFYR